MGVHLFCSCIISYLLFALYHSLSTASPRSSGQFHARSLLRSAGCPAASKKDAGSQRRLQPWASRGGWLCASSGSGLRWPPLGYYTRCQTGIARKGPGDGEMVFFPPLGNARQGALAQCSLYLERIPDTEYTMLSKNKTKKCV